MASSTLVANRQAVLDQMSKIVGHQRSGARDADLRSQLGQQMDVRAGDAAVKNVADDRDLEPVDLAFVFADRHRVEQCLRRMFVRPVAGIDDRGLLTFGELMRHARRTSGGRRCSPAPSRRDSVRYRAAFRLSDKLDDETLILTASAERRFAASSKEVRVRVEDSKKRLMTVLPRRAGTFLTSRCRDLAEILGSIENADDIRGVRSRIPSRSLSSKRFFHQKRHVYFSLITIKKARREALLSSIRSFKNADGLDVVKFFEHHLYISFGVVSARTFR